MLVCPGYILLPARYTWVQRAFRIWDPVPRRRQGPGRRGRGLKAPETTRVGETLDPRTVAPFSLSLWVSRAPSSLRLCCWQPSRARAGALAAPGTCRATFVLGADCGRRRDAPSGPGRKGARACARPWEPRLLPVPASSLRKQSLRLAGRLGRNSASGRPGPRPRSTVGASGLGCPLGCSCKVGIRVWM